MRQSAGVEMLLEHRCSVPTSQGSWILEIRIWVYSGLEPWDLYRGVLGQGGRQIIWDGMFPLRVTW
jgi:hypothetical protein